MPGSVLVVTYDTSTGKYLARKAGSAQIADGAIVSAKIGALAVGTPHLAANAIVSGKVASGGLPPLTSGKIWAGYTGNIPREEDKPTGAATFLALTDTPGDFSGNANKVVAVNVGEDAVEFADPIPKTTDWKGSFNWDTSAYTTNEQDISALFDPTLALVTRRKYSVKLDLTAVEADASFDKLWIAVKEKIDGTNYRAIDRKEILKADIAASAEPGIPIDIPATSENIQITIQMNTTLAADATIYYAVVKEHLE